MKGFYDKGRVAGLLQAVPVYAVLVEDIGLRGAHFVAMRVRGLNSREGGSGEVFFVPTDGYFCRVSARHEYAGLIVLRRVFPARLQCANEEEGVLFATFVYTYTPSPRKRCQCSTGMADVSASKGNYYYEVDFDARLPPHTKSHAAKHCCYLPPSSLLSSNPFLTAVPRTERGGIQETPVAQGRGIFRDERGRRGSFSGGGRRGHRTRDVQGLN